MTGSGFDSDIKKYTVTIDNRNCIVTSATATQVKCTTASRPGLFANPTFEINIAGKGRVATQGNVFRYVNYWSDTVTWGGEFAPIKGDLVYIPKGLSLLVDVNETPILSAVVV